MAQAVRWQLEEALPWTEHYVKYGFCLLRGLLDRDQVEAGLAAARALVGDPRPPRAWDIDRPGPRHSVHYFAEAPAIDRLCEAPRLLAALAQLFGGLGVYFGTTRVDDPDRRRFALWVNPYDPDARQRLERLGHIDSGSPYRGVALHIALHDSRPFSGNTAYFPGSHIEMHRRYREQPDLTWPGGVYPEIARPLPPWEFIADAGDVVIAHHLLCHTGNASHADDCTPRIVVRQEVFPARPLARLDPERPELSPFERSLAFGGAVTLAPDGAPLTSARR